MWCRVSLSAWATSRPQQGITCLSLQGAPTYVVCCAIFCSVDPWKQAVSIPGSHKSPQGSHIICIFIKKSKQKVHYQCFLFLFQKAFLWHCSNDIPSDSNNPWCSVLCSPWCSITRCCDKRTCYDLHNPLMHEWIGKKNRVRFLVSWFFCPEWLRQRPTRQHRNCV